MRKALSILLGCILVLQLNADASTGAVAAEKIFTEANEAYRKNDFSTAISLYEKLIQLQNNSATVYYNLANAHYKSGNLGQAILNYERAERLAPFDEDIRHNLEFARHRTVDQLQSQAALGVEHFTEKFLGILSSLGWKILALVLVWLGFGLLALYVFSVKWKGLGIYGGVICLLFAGGTYWCGNAQGSIEQKCHFRIVTNAEAYVKSAPDNSSTDLFLIHEGTKIQVFDEVGEYMKIRIADGRVGWVLRDETTKI